MRHRSRFLAGIGVVLLVLSLSLRARAQYLHCNPRGNQWCAPGEHKQITTSLDPISMVWVDNYVIWVNGEAHQGQSYDLPADPNLNPYQYTYYATATIYFHRAGSSGLNTGTAKSRDRPTTPVAGGWAAGCIRANRPRPGTRSWRTHP
jgi:hypothetical protein